MLVNLSFSVLLHVLFIFIALSILFIFVISKSEKNAFQREIDNRLTPKIVEAIKKADKNGRYKVYIRKNMAVAEQLDNLYSQNSKATEINNRYLRILMVIVGVLLLLCIVVPILYLTFAAKYEVPFGEILLENAILFVLVGGFEVFFFLQFAKNYVPVLPSKFIDRVYANLNK